MALADRLGRIEEEKNPLMLAEVLARLSGGDERWTVYALAHTIDTEAERVAELLTA